MVRGGRRTCERFERSRVRLPFSALPGNLYVNSAVHPSGVGKSSTSLLAGVKTGRVHLCRVADYNEMRYINQRFSGFYLPVYLVI